MKILVCNGSPKREKSDTLHLTRAFLAGMDDVRENETHIIHVIDRHIEYCTGCFACKKNGGTCIHNDDMKGILDEILQSDVLILSFSLYCYSMPAPLKALIDRTMPLSSMAMRKVEGRYEHVEQADFSRLRYVMLCGCGLPNAEHNFEGMIAQFGLMFGENSVVLTVPEAPMFNEPKADFVTKPFLELVRQAGREYAQTGKISAQTRNGLLRPMIPEEVYAKICNAEQ